MPLAFITMAASFLPYPAVSFHVCIFQNLCVVVVCLFIMLCDLLLMFTLSSQCLEMAGPVSMTVWKSEQKMTLQMNTMNRTGLVWVVRPFLVP